MNGNLDGMDKQILERLRKDGKMSAVRLAAELNVPRSTVTERVRRLERNQTILGYSARVNHRALGEGQTVFVMVQLKETPSAEEFAHRLARFPEIHEIHVVTGEWDIVMKVRTENLESMYKLHRDIVAMGGIGRVATFPCSKTVRDPL